MHGAVNDPLRLVRTVVVGQNRQLVERVLNVLSYFIRCGNSSYFDIVQDESSSAAINASLDGLHSQSNQINLNLNLTASGHSKKNAANSNNTSSSSSSSSSHVNGQIKPKELNIHNLNHQHPNWVFRFYFQLF